MAGKRDNRVPAPSSRWLVTGANRGIGLAFAREIAQRGDAVIATAREPAKAKDLAETGARVEPLDVSADLEEARELARVEVLDRVHAQNNGGWYEYRASKAALNMLMRTLAAELAPERFICVVLSPGWVKTDMGGEGATLTPQESVRAMLRVIDGLTSKDSGKFLDHRGRELPW